MKGNPHGKRPWSLSQPSFASTPLTGDPRRLALDLPFFKTKRKTAEGADTLNPPSGHQGTEGLKNFAGNQNFGEKCTYATDHPNERVQRRLSQERGERRKSNETGSWEGWSALFKVITRRPISRFSLTQKSRKEREVHDSE